MKFRMRIGLRLQGANGAAERGKIAARDRDDQSDGRMGFGPFTGALSRQGGVRRSIVSVSLLQAIVRIANQATAHFRPDQAERFGQAVLLHRPGESFRQMHDLSPCGSFRRNPMQHLSDQCFPKHCSSPPPVAMATHSPNPPRFRQGGPPVTLTTMWTDRKSWEVALVPSPSGRYLARSAESNKPKLDAGAALG